ncbi:MAG TPA: hypothetical protein VFA60_13525 [Terriglobales bacterium]|nr:hypothetical protein [Terriglobales bacterium]
MLAVALASVAGLAHAQHARPAAAPAARLMPGVGEVNHPVRTSNPEAQRFFNQGLALDYGFNHDEAEKAFWRAAELDPTMAMAWWGVALVVGPNYNLPIDQEREKKAFEAIQKARRLAANGPEPERDYIEALAKRYTDNPNADFHQLDVDYNNAMRELSKKYPDDLDAATLFAESGMTLRPWKLWNADHTPAPGTGEIVETLESVLRRNPQHIGANHFYIHAVEASAHPEAAMPSALRLAALAPSSGHLVHMPGHIFIRTGDHESSLATNINAARADENYIKTTQAHGVYPMMYYTHNLHFIVMENAMMGRYAESLAAARKVQAHVGPHIKDMDLLDFFNTMPSLVMVRFRKWDDILKSPAPAAGSGPYTAGTWHYARGLAFAAQGKEKETITELDALQKLAPEMAKIPTNTVGPGNAQKIPVIAAHVIQARLASSLGKTDEAVAHLREAVSIQDTLDYNEPPDWFYPVRETLGGTLLRAGRAAEAEQVFRADLAMNPRNARSLFGLMESLKAQKRAHDAAFVEQEFKSAWKGADTQLRIEDL